MVLSPGKFQRTLRNSKPSSLVSLRWKIKKKQCVRETPARLDEQNLLRWAWCANSVISPSHHFSSLRYYITTFDKSVSQEKYFPNKRKTKAQKSILKYSNWKWKFLLFYTLPPPFLVKIPRRERLPKVSDKGTGHFINKIERFLSKFWSRKKN